MKILQTHPVPVVPVALQNLWGSYFSRFEAGRAMVNPERLHQRVAQLLVV